MIYYIYIFSAVALFALQITVMKFYERNSVKSLITSLIFIVISGAFNAFIFLALSKFQLEFSLPSFYFAIALAIMLVINSVAGIAVVSLGNISVYSMFLLLGGTVLPFIYGLAILNEKVTVFKILGICLMLVSLILPIIQTKKENEKTNVKYILLCVVAFLANGFVSVFSKANQITADRVNSQNFVFYYSAFSAFLSLVLIGVVLLISNKKQQTLLSAKSCFKIKPITFAIAYAICNGFGNFLLLLSATSIDASIQYPIVTGGTIFLTTILDKLIFNQKLSALAYVGIGLTLISTIIFVL